MINSSIKHSLFSWLLLASHFAIADEGRVVDEFTVKANINAVWDAFTTSAGLQSWVAPLADIELKVGGKWRANYNLNGTLGDESTVVNTILSYDPMRMLSIKATGFPAGFAYEEAARETWSIFYFNPISATETQITIVGLGYTDSEQSKQMRSFFKPANEFSMAQLKQALEQQERPQESEQK
ncbi:SRPBCC family protein [Marinicella meishanensis]|uniref:SRPBCC family protein n=1 Tax=Marinicella meishanensis TaxID=2873263 RepID=UPI001CBE6ED1|nr:SRPBCC domain-containing protein [Marinicella sp. NBU2979]